MRVYGSWTRGTATGYYQNTYSLGRSSGSALGLWVKAKRVTLIAKTCSGCGLVDVYFAGQFVKRISLAASTTTLRRAIAIASFTSARSGTVYVKIVSSSEPVVIDGLAVSLV